MGVGYIPEKGTLKTARSKVQTNTNGDGLILIKVPGTNGKKSRLVEGGEGWFDNPHPDDWVKISISDEDNILGNGAGFEAGSYYDGEVPYDNQGWYICSHRKYVSMKALSDMGNLLGGLYLKIIVKKGDNSQDWFRCNFKWGSFE